MPDRLLKPQSTMPAIPRDRRSERLSFFGTYDIRGRFPREIGPEEVEHLAAAFACVGTGPLLVGRDVRYESKKLEKLLVAALSRHGRRVVALGVQATPAIGFAAAHFRRTSLALTPSHNAVGYVGIKAFSPNGGLFAREWAKVRRLYLHSIQRGNPTRRRMVQVRRGLSRSPKIHEWTEAYLEHLTRGRGSAHSIVVDSRGGATAHVAPVALQRMGAKVTSLHPGFSATFNGQSPEPTPVNVAGLGRAVRFTKADFGVTFDGDGDRVAFVDRRGRWVEPEVVALFLQQELATPDKVLVASADASSRCETKARILRSRVGSRYVLSAMRKSRAIVGFEISGHYYLPKWDPNSDGILTACVVSDLLSRSSRRLDELIDEFGPIFRRSSAIAFSSHAEAVRNYDALCRSMAAHGTVPGVDGISLRTASGTVHGRPSNTEPTIRFTLEASNKTGLKKLERFARELIPVSPRSARK
jgi:phosphomannomutase / phosphoglucomutase